MSTEHGGGENEAHPSKVSRIVRLAGGRPSSASGGGTLPVSVLALCAAAYGARPSDETTVPTGFDPLAVSLFEAIVEASYLVASADGVFDDEERKVFEYVVVAASGGAVAPPSIHGLVAELDALKQSDGLDLRVKQIAALVHKTEHAKELVRIAALLAHTSDGVSDVEREVLHKLATACGLATADADSAIERVRAALDHP